MSTPTNSDQVLRLVHPKYVSCMAFGDGNEYVTGSGEGSVRVFNNNSASHPVFPIHKDEIYDIAHLSGSLYVSSSYDNHVTVFDSRNGNVNSSVKVDAPKRIVVLSRHEYIVAIASDVGAVIIVNLHPSWPKSSRILGRLKFEGNVSPTCLATSHQRNNADCKLYVGYRNREIGTWNWRSKELCDVWRGHADSLCALSVSADGNVISLAQDRTARVWTSQGRCVGILPHDDIPKAAACYGSRLVVTGDDQGVIRVWDSRHAIKLMTRSINNRHKAVRDVKVSAAGLIFSASNDRTLCVWDFREEISRSALRLMGTFIGMDSGETLMSTEQFVQAQRVEIDQRFPLTHFGQLTKHNRVNEPARLGSSCVVCLEDFQNESQCRLLRCGHIFHAACIDHWIATNNRCPLDYSVVIDRFAF
eukprot:CAMPEP_0182444548 /NCGR_PEP_ID=MMETSP1172-20130603/2958_1 /TAXON_ID=708627 /ORGANISM="Timspurckia oligopyrenoides, Strain CCMP3278" /LENGTH=416 /DNA_ID=CAMNT_0024640125 /DNA_START=287 /DNA_END=1537 /DNA_ORIENTATION=+